MQGKRRKNGDTMKRKTGKRGAALLLCLALCISGRVWLPGNVQEVSAAEEGTKFLTVTSQEDVKTLAEWINDPNMNDPIVVNWENPTIVLGVIAAPIWDTVTQSVTIISLNKSQIIISGGTEIIIGSGGSLIFQDFSVLQQGMGISDEVTLTVTDGGMLDLGKAGLPSNISVTVEPGGQLMVDDVSISPAFRTNVRYDGNSAYEKNESTLQYLVHYDGRETFSDSAEVDGMDVRFLSGSVRNFSGDNYYIAEEVSANSITFESGSVSVPDRVNIINKSNVPVTNKSGAKLFVPWGFPNLVNGTILEAHGADYSRSGDIYHIMPDEGYTVNHITVGNEERKEPASAIACATNGTKSFTIPNYAGSLTCSVEPIRQADPGMYSWTNPASYTGITGSEIWYGGDVGGNPLVQITAADGYLLCPVSEQGNDTNWVQQKAFDSQNGENLQQELVLIDQTVNEDGTPTAAYGTMYNVNYTYSQDTAPPQGNITVQTASGASYDPSSGAWSTEKLIVTAELSDNLSGIDAASPADGSGKLNVTETSANENRTSVTVNIDFPSEGAYEPSLEITDQCGNTSTTDPISVKFDTKPPYAYAHIVKPDGGTESVEVKDNEVYTKLTDISVYDDVSGLDRIVLESDEESKETESTIYIPNKKTDKTYQLKIYDIAGHETVYQNFTIKAYEQDLALAGGTAIGAYGGELVIPVTVMNTHPSEENGDDTAVLHTDTVSFAGKDGAQSLFQCTAAGDVELKSGSSQELRITLPADTPPGSYEAELTLPYFSNTDHLEKDIQLTLAAEVTKRPLTLKSELTKTKVYDGTVDAAVTASVEGIVNQDDVTVTASAVYDTPDAGSQKTITITYDVTGADVDLYEIQGGTTVTDAGGEITRADGTASFSLADSYFGEALHPVYTSDTNGTNGVLLSYKKAGDADTAYTSEIPAAEGSYTARAEFPAVQNYNAVVLTDDFAITRQAASADMYTVNEPESSGGWYTSDVIVSAGLGYTLSQKEDGSFTDHLTIADSVEDYTFYVRTKTGAVTAPVALGAVRIDRTPPQCSESEGIYIKENLWQKFLDTVSFGQKEKEAVDGTISAHDDESKVTEISYYIVQKAMTAAEVTALSDADWTVGSTFTVGSGTPGTYVIYAKIKNGAGLVTYLSSDGMTIDTQAPVISGIEDGKTYAEEEIEVTVTDYSLKSAAVNGAAKEVVSDNTGAVSSVFTLTAKEDGDTTYLVEAEDVCGNKASCTVILQKMKQKTPKKVDKAGKVTLNKETQYQFSSGAWRVTGDPTSYAGDVVFYVSEDGEYELTQE